MIDKRLPFEEGIEQGLRDFFSKTRQFFTMMAIDLIIVFGVALVIVKSLSPDMRQWLIGAIIALSISVFLARIGSKKRHSNDAP